MDQSSIRRPLLLDSPDSPVGYRLAEKRNFDSEYVNGNAMLPFEETSSRFVIARGGEEFMRDIIEYQPQRPDTQAEFAQSVTDNIVSRLVYGLLLPCRGLSFFVKRGFTMQSKAAGYFGVACAVSCTSAVLEGVLQLLNAVRTTCLVRAGHYNDCCSCLDMSAFEAMSFNHTFVTPMIEERNEQLYAAGAISTGLITLAMFYLAVRGENPYIAYVAIFCLCILVAIRIIDLSDTGSTAYHVARLTLTASTVAGLVLAAILLKATTKSFGLIGARRGGLGVGARVHSWYLVNRAMSYADQFATYGFYATTFWVLAEKHSSTGQNTFAWMCFTLWLADATASCLLVFVVKCEMSRGALLAMSALLVSFIGWCLVIRQYQSCYTRGVDTQTALGDALQLGINSAQVTFWVRNASNTSWSIVSQHTPWLTSPPTVGLVPTVSSIHELLDDTKDCLASNTVFSKETTFILVIMWAMLALCRLAVIVTTALSVRWYFGSRKISKLFFVFDDNIDDEEKLTVGDVM